VQNLQDHIYNFVLDSRCNRLNGIKCFYVRRGRRRRIENNREFGYSGLVRKDVALYLMHLDFGRWIFT
jgi:hypothetical protein